ncbi:MAG: Glu/Leu/Phe/Val dehydrogenase [Candidatus Pacearchaeota archaeon]
MEIFENIKILLNKISLFTNISEEEKNILMSYKQIKRAILNINGKKYEAYRIIHNNSLGPGKGGIRYHPNVSEDEVKSLSFFMSMKNSLAGLPFGGAKGGVKVNPKELNEKEIEEISRAYIREFYKFLGQDIDIPAPDVYTNSKIMGFMLDEFEKITGKHEPGMITGKPISLGGIRLREDSTSKGGFIVLKRFFEKEKVSRNIKIAIQGFGNAGSFIAEMLFNENYKIVAVSDSKGGILNNSGLNIKDIKNLKQNQKSVIDLKTDNIQIISNKELLELDVDLLILAALENQITNENAEKIKAKFILELANGPITSEADNILFNKKILVIPDILSNSGGVVGSYFEWVQNRTGNIFEDSYLTNKLEEMITNSFEKVYNFYKENEERIDMRTAAYVIAIKRILEAERDRGNLNHNTLK